MLDQAIEETEDGLFDSRREAIERVQRRSFQLRKSLVVLRRITLPTREVVNTLLRHDLDIVREPMAPYFRDVYDHVIRATEWTESLRDLVTTMVETNLTVQSNRMNLIMKKVTSWAAIIAVPDRHHRLVRPERPLSRLRQDLRIDRFDGADRGAGRRALRAVPPQGLALNQRPLCRNSATHRPA